MRLKRFFLYSVYIVFFSLSFQALSAFCNLTPTGTVTIPFSSVLTPNQLTTTKINSSGSITFNLACNPEGLAVNILSAPLVLTFTRIMPLELKNGDRSLFLEFSPFNDYSYLLNQTSTAFYVSFSAILLLGLPTVQIPAYFRTELTNRWPKAGIYTGSFEVEISGYFCNLSIAICLLSEPIQTRRLSFEASIEIAKYCAFFSVPPKHALGERNFLDSVTTHDIKLSIRCGQDEDFIVYANNGLNHDGNSRRLNNLTDYIRYDLYHPASSTQLLGNSASNNPYHVLGTGLTQEIVIPLRIPVQSTPKAGTYTDTVTFKVEY